MTTTFYLVGALIINTCRKGKWKEFSNKDLSMQQKGRNINIVHCIYIKPYRDIMNP